LGGYPQTVNRDLIPNRFAVFLHLKTDLDLLLAYRLKEHRNLKVARFFDISLLRRLAAGK